MSSASEVNVPAAFFKAHGNSREATMARNAIRVSEIISIIRDSESPSLPVGGPFASSESAWDALKRIVSEIE